MHSFPPYAVIPAEFRFRALAIHAGRLPLGGERELALATLLGARLVAGAADGERLQPSVRKTRAQAARVWSTALTLPAAARSVLQHLFEATASDDLPALSAAFNELVALAYPSLDAASRYELRHLATSLGSSGST